MGIGDPMPEVFNPVSVEAAIRECANRISNGVIECNRTYKAFLQADHEYDLAFARAWAKDNGPANARKYVCELQTVEERQKRDNADAVYRFSDRQAKALEAELRSWQSVGASIRQAYGVSGRGEGA